MFASRLVYERNEKTFYLISSMKSQLKILTLFSLMAFSIEAQDKYAAMFNTGIEHEAENLGGKRELKRFLHDHLTYPPAALIAKQEGKVKIRCMISAKGEASQVEITDSVSPELNREALRLFRLLCWTPAIARATKEPVGSLLQLTIPFSIPHYRKYCKERGFGQSLFTAFPIDTSLTLHEKADKIPAYLYGRDSLVKYINAQLKYPQTAKKLNIEGTVVLGFVVETNGMLSNIRVEKPVGGGCSEEAIEVIKHTRWTPAISEGKYVRYKVNYPIAFTLHGIYHDNIIKEQRQ